MVSNSYYIQTGYITMWISLFLDSAESLHRPEVLDKRYTSASCSLKLAKLCSVFLVLLVHSEYDYSNGFSLSRWCITPSRFPQNSPFIPLSLSPFAFIQV